jgi:hypothetical protein
MMKELAPRFAQGNDGRLVVSHAVSFLFTKINLGKEEEK